MNFTVVANDIPAVRRYVCGANVSVAGWHLRFECYSPFGECYYFVVVLSFAQCYCPADSFTSDPAVDERKRQMKPV